MDSMGDAVEYEIGDELPRPQAPLLTSEALAVTALATAMGSLFVTTISQYLAFVVSGPLGLNGNDRGKQVALLIAPSLILSFAAVAAGLTAVKRRPEDRWVAAMSVAGVAVGAVILVLAAATLLAALVSNPAASAG
jgi:hypothetical protein